jgi:hypothetical protein
VISLVEEEEEEEGFRVWLAETGNLLLTWTIGATVEPFAVACDLGECCQRAVMADADITSEKWVLDADLEGQKQEQASRVDPFA